MRPTVPDYDQAPYLVIWEATRACDLACRHCRADAHAEPYPDELSDAEARALLSRLREGFGPILLVLTGGDPLKRAGLDGLIRHGTDLGLRMAITPAATPLLTRARLDALRAAGIQRVALSLDGADAATHDGFRQVEGTFARTVALLREIRAAGMESQINTSVGRHNLAQLEAIAALGREAGISLWSVFFLVPVGRAGRDALISAQEHEEAFRRLAAIALDPATGFMIKTTAGQPYYRVLAQERARRGGGAPLHAGRGVNDGNGFLFISHVGDCQPSGFLAEKLGNIREHDPVALYREHPLLRGLRQPERFGGKCGPCPFARLCGGSRARTWALTGDAFAEDPTCVYQPPGR
jgi:MoaA/NifB/PqqE/SkfB family radical SAM enzyme